MISQPGCSRCRGRTTRPTCGRRCSRRSSTPSSSFVGAAVLGLVVALLRLSRAARALRILGGGLHRAVQERPAARDHLPDLLRAGLGGHEARRLRGRLPEPDPLLRRLPLGDLPRGDQRRARRPAGGGRGARARAGARPSRTSIFPQALRLALPGTNTMLVDLLKSTSLLVTISAAELMSEGQLIASATFRALEVYLVIAAIYFALCYPLSQACCWLERKVRAGVPLMPRRRRRLRAARALLADGALGMTRSPEQPRRDHARTVGAAPTGVAPTSSCGSTVCRSPSTAGSCWTTST